MIEINLYYILASIIIFAIGILIGKSKRESEVNWVIVEYLLEIEKLKRKCDKIKE